MLSSLLSQFVSFIVDTIGAWGYVGILILMALESSLVPVPSEAVLIPAGFLISQGLMSFWAVFIISLLGSIIGSLVSYLIALSLGRPAFNALAKRYGKFILLKVETLEKTERYFENHGEITIFLCRLIPVVRHLISLPAGFARMNLTKFTLYTALGSGIWSIILIYMGYVIGENKELIQQNLHLLTAGVILFAGIVIVGYILIKRRRK